MQLRRREKGSYWTPDGYWQICRVAPSAWCIYSQAEHNMVWLRSQGLRVAFPTLCEAKQTLQAHLEIGGFTLMEGSDVVCPSLLPLRRIDSDAYLTADGRVRVCREGSNWYLWQAPGLPLDQRNLPSGYQVMTFATRRLALIALSRLLERVIDEP